MSDHFEKFVRSNREQFDQLEPKAELWDKLQQGLSQQAATQAASSSASSAGASGLAKVGAIWKMAAVAVVVGITGTALYFGLSGKAKDGKTDGTQPAPGQTVAATTDSAANQPETPLVNPPIAGATVAYHSFTVEVAKGTVHTLPNGSKVTVPANGFVTADGQPVTGSVTLQYREFHDAADVLVSGIPMLYNEKGKPESGIFQTAGMIELIGNQNGEAVAIAPGKPITIDMTSYTDEDDYNLYFLDPAQRGWKDIGKAELRKPKTAKVEPDEEQASKAGKGQDIAPRKPLDPAKINKNTELSFAVDYTDFPEFKPFKNLRWVAADAAELKKKEWIFTQVWNEVELKRLDGKDMAYRFILKNKKKKAELSAYPLLEGEDYQKALADFNASMAKHDKLNQQRRQEGMRKVAEARVVRSFQVAGFGIYNCDRIYKMKNATTMQCEFAFDEDSYVDPAKTKIYHLTGDFNVVVPIENYAKGYSLSYSTSAKNYLVAVMANGSIGLFGPGDFRNLDTRKVILSGKPAQLKLANTGKFINSPEELRSLLDV